MKDYFKLIRYVRPYLSYFILGLICILLASGSQLALPWVIKDVIDDVLTNKDMHMLNLISVGILILFIVRGVMVYGQSYLMEYVAQRVVCDLRNQMFDRIIRLRGLAYFEKNRTGSVMSHFTNDIGALQNAIVNQGVEFVRESFVLVASVALMLTLNWQLTLLLFITVPIIGVAVKKIGSKIKNAGRKVLGQLSVFTGILQETLAGIRVVKSFAREDHETARFSKLNNDNLRAIMKATRARALLTPIVELFATVGVIILIWVGGREVIEGNMSSGSLVAFLIYAINLSNPIKRVSKTYTNMQQALAGCERVFASMEFEPEVKDLPEARLMPAIKGEVRFDHVNFSYDKGKPVISDFNFTVEPGKMVALVGHSGAGKTTLVNLVMRFYDVTSGAVLIDGTDLRDVTQVSLREQIGIVPQESLLFSGTIMENIRYGRLDATDEEVLAAGRAAHVAEFVDQMPEGYETIVGERGASLSGGQRQRVSIARAVLKDPRILILDEATSALDTESEKLVQEALDSLLKNRTSFVIAHRLSTIFKADIILVMDHGRLAEWGCHEELLAQNGIYANLYHTQFRDAEERIKGSL
ncbi:ABC transporter ATP-binding protein [Deltaproteobacteria bacterium Smac51]|nr:ABC transporter ATP-binding protein [Deltaproteobacteria bacterium Smac51]